MRRRIFNFQFSIFNFPNITFRILSCPDIFFPLVQTAGNTPGCLGHPNTAKKSFFRA
jgi:hypothetical protein